VRRFGVTGLSDSGKTTLVCRLLPRLRARGLRVATVKHAHHGFDLLPAGHPAHAWRAAGAKDIVLAALDRHAQLRETGCTRAVLVGHNPAFDLSFVHAAARRAGYKRNPFHAFTEFDTAPLGGLAYGQTVLARTAEAAGLGWDAREAHSAIYDAEMTAELFCRIVNRWDELAGVSAPV